MEESSTASRYYCHMCSLIVSPVVGIEEVKCPHCHTGFVEEMANARIDGGRGNHSDSTIGDNNGGNAEAGTDAPDAISERAMSLWAPLLMDILGGPPRRDAHEDGDFAAFAARRYRNLAFLQLLNALREGGEQVEADGNAADAAREQLVLISPTDVQSMLGQDRVDGNGTGAGSGLTLGDLFLGPGQDLLLEYLSEIDPSRQGTPPAKKEAVDAMPTVRVREAATSCPVCLDEFAVGDKVREMPCKHRFHDSCIKPWLEMHSSCPVCRYQMPTDEPREPIGNGNGAEGTGSESSNGNGRRHWLAWPFGRLFSERSNGNSSSL